MSNRSKVPQPQAFRQDWPQHQRHQTWQSQERQGQLCAPHRPGGALVNILGSLNLPGYRTNWIKKVVISIIFQQNKRDYITSFNHVWVRVTGRIIWIHFDLVVSPSFMSLATQWMPNDGLLSRPSRSRSIRKAPMPLTTPKSNLRCSRDRQWVSQWLKTGRVQKGNIQHLDIATSWTFAGYEFRAMHPFRSE